MKDDELEHERKIQEALQKIENANRGHNQAGDLLLGVYVNNLDGHCVTLKVSQHGQQDHLVCIL